MRVAARARQALNARAFLLIPLAVLAAGLLLRLVDPEPLQELRLRAFDFYQVVDPRPASSLPVKIVAVDEASLQRLGQWPWPRSRLAELTEKIGTAGARALVFTTYFPEPDRLTPEALLALLPGDARAEVAGALQAGAMVLPDQDFAEALADTPSVLGFALRAGTTERAAPLRRTGFSFIGQSPLPFLPLFGGAVPSLPSLQEAAKGNGAITLQVDSDGVTRRLPLLVAVEEEVYPALAVEALRVAQGGRGLLVKSSGEQGTAQSAREIGVEAIRIVRDIVPTTPRGGIWLYDRPPDPADQIPAWQVLAGDETISSALQGAIVLVGVTAGGLGERHTTPLSARLPGVVLQAQAIEQIWSGVYLDRPAWTAGAEVLAVALVGLLVLLPFAVQREGALLSALLGLIAVLGGLAFAWWAFSQWRLLFDPVTPALVGGLVFLSAGLARLVVSERRRSEVRQAFGRYVAPEVVARIAENPSATRLAGETRTLSVLFCDIRGFTALSESLPPDQLARLINRFLTTMSEAVLAGQGTIDKYIGDCIMAFWNAPMAVQGHERAACLTILEMRRRLRQLNGDLAAESKGAEAPQLAMGMGINSGACSVGNMGSDFRLAYTAMGDTVNLAARLEGMTRIYQLDCLISSSLRAQVAASAEGDLAFLEVDRIQVKGRSQPETVYALLGDAALASGDDFKALEAAQARFLAAYRSQDWSRARQALSALSTAAEGFTLQGLLSLFAERLDALEAKPPAPDWDGVYVATSK